MPQTYALDTTGALAANAITQEAHTVSAVASSDYNYLIPKFAPFFAGSLKVYLDENGVQTLLKEGVDYNLAAHFSSASEATAKPIYGAISWSRTDFTGSVLIDYQTLGGEYVLDDQKRSEIIARIVYNPRGLTWEEITSLPKLFPPVAHTWNVNDMTSMRDVTNAIKGVERAIINRPSTPGGSSVPITKASIGLDRVENYPPASIADAVAGDSDESLITPKALKTVLDALGFASAASDIEKLKRHLVDTNNPHGTDAQAVGLGNVENLPIATPSDIIAKRNVKKYLTLEGAILFNSLWGCKPCSDQQAPCAPKGALLSAYCSNYNNMGVYANGDCTTYEKVIELNSPDCGYRPPAQVQHPARGTVLSNYCVSGDLYEYIADGLGGIFQQFKERQSDKCKNNPAPQPGPNHPAAGTILATRCEGTTRVNQVANGQGGSTEQRIDNDPSCGYKQHPAKGTFIRTECRGKDLYNILADGNGGEESALAQANASSCGGTVTPPPPPKPPKQKRMEAGTNMPAVKAGDRETIFVRLYGFDANQSIGVTGYGVNPDFNNGQPYAFVSRFTIQTNDQGEGQWTKTNENTADSIEYLFQQANQDNAVAMAFSCYFQADDGTKSPTYQRTIMKAASGPKARLNNFPISSFRVGECTKLPAVFSNLVVGQQYTIQFTVDDKRYYDSSTFTATAKEVPFELPVCNEGRLENGPHSFKVYIAKGAAAPVLNNQSNSNQGVSNAVSVTYVVNRRFNIRLNNTTNTTVTIGNNVKVGIEMVDFPQNKNVYYYLIIRGPMDNRDIGNGNGGNWSATTNGNGYYNASFDTTLAVDGNVRGTHTYQFMAKIQLVTGETISVGSNIAYCTFNGGAGGGGGGQKSISYSANPSTLRVGTVGNQIVRFSGYPPNTTVYFTMWHEARNVPATETHIKNIAVNIGADGTGSWTYYTGEAVKQSDLDSVWAITGTPASTSTVNWYSWIIDNSGVRSNRVTRTFTRSSGGGGGGGWGPGPGSFGP